MNISPRKFPVKAFLNHTPLYFDANISTWPTNLTQLASISVTKRFKTTAKIQTQYKNKLN